jgi:hypothetical protein
MAKIDWEKERERLKRLYSAMSDGELEKVADESDSLTDVARAALRSEMLRRGMEPPPEIKIPVGGREGEATHPELVMVGRYRDLPNASVAKSILDSAGIEGFLADENMVRLDWFYSNLVGGIKLMVREEDADTSKKLLEQSVPENFEVEGVGTYEQARCPKCGSLDVSIDELDKRIAYPGFLLSLPIRVIHKGGKCHSCGHEWEENGEIPLASSKPAPAEKPQ